MNEIPQILAGMRTERIDEIDNLKMLHEMMTYDSRKKSGHLDIKSYCDKLANHMKEETE